MSGIGRVDGVGGVGAAARILGLDPLARPRVRPRPDLRPGVTVLIPTHSGPGNRPASLARSLQSLAAQARAAGTSAAVVVVDGGLSASDGSAVRHLLGSLDLPHELVPGPPAGSRCAAAARNAGLERLAALPAGSPLLHRHLLFLDDDTALAPGGPAALSDVLDRHPDAVAACPRIVTVPSVAGWLPGAPAARPVPSTVLPGSLHGGRYDLLSVTAFGSLVAGRVVGLLVRADLLLGWLASGGRLFFPGTPRGSSEDMLAMATLSQLGDLRAAPGVLAADQMRADPPSTRAQQLGWGYDHAWLTGPLGEAGLLEPGMHVLTWSAGRWLQHSLPGAEHVGFLVHPPELRLLGGLLSEMSEHSDCVQALFGVSPDEFAAAVSALGAVLDRLPDLLDRARAVPRPDLPARQPRSYGSVREGLDGLLAQLAGSALGSLAHGTAADGLPRRFLYGLRQATDGVVLPRAELARRANGRPVRADDSGGLTTVAG